ncbi:MULTISPECIES: hypothetical protein [unclassified Streptomyces]|uniref:hypothetical protein n=1 Tax=unclassified Streptomyces TaxID=2593676 RepID=UPI000B8A429E|nr:MULTISPECIES: hypothetical protein [unclassified Streptomyces]MYR93078.1 hypothetical protein [Streptomyces sp. SID4937]
MDWGDAFAGLACVIAAGALVVSMLARRDGKKSANAATASVSEARRSADAAEASVSEARRSGDAAERSAVAAEESLAEQRREARERREAEEEANRPRPSFVLEHKAGHTFRLRNVGTGGTTGINLVARAEPYLFDSLANEELVPGEAVSFRMAGAMGRPIPGTLYVTWDGQSDPVALPVPNH